MDCEHKLKVHRTIPYIKPIQNGVADQKTKAKKITITDSKDDSQKPIKTDAKYVLHQKLTERKITKAARVKDQLVQLPSKNLAATEQKMMPTNSLMESIEHLRDSIRLPTVEPMVAELKLSLSADSRSKDLPTTFLMNWLRGVLQERTLVTKLANGQHCILKEPKNVLQPNLTKPSIASQKTRWVSWICSWEGMQHHEQPRPKSDGERSPTIEEKSATYKG